MQNKDSKRYITNKIQAICFTSLVILFIFVMAGVKMMQGITQVVKCVDSIRGEAQRIVKLEMAGETQDELIDEVDRMLMALTNVNGEYELIRIHSFVYQVRLNEVNKYWPSVKNEIMLVREKGWENTKLIGVSERFYELTDVTVDAVDAYAQKCTSYIIRLEVAIIIVGIIMIIITFKRLSISFDTLKQNYKLHEQAYFDVLTNIYNRRFFDEFITKLDREKKDYTLCYIDLDHLKRVNDNYGHAMGDEYILFFVEMIKREFRNDDIFCRLGGDEFCLILLGCSNKLAEQKLEILRKKFIESEKNIYDGSFSYGVISIDGVFNQLTISDVLHAVDEKMYQYKIAHRCQRDEVQHI